jgi:hypothetical protein
MITKKKDLSDSDEWEMVPNADDVKVLSVSVDNNTSLICHPSIHKSDTLDSQPELEHDEDESPKHNRYNSPLFQSLLGQPIEPVKLSKPSIPADDSINNLLHTASLVSKSQKSPEPVEQIKTNQIINEEPSVEQAIDEKLFKELSVADKRPSMQDPETVLMQNVVPGEKKNSF